MFSLGASERYLYFCSVSAVNSTPSPGKRGGRTYPSSIVGGSETGHRSIRSRSGPMEGSPDACLWVNSQAGRRSPSPVDPAHRCPGCGHRPRSLRRSSVGVRLSQGHDLLLLLLSASTERRKDFIAFPVTETPHLPHPEPANCPRARAGPLCPSLRSIAYPDPTLRFPSGRDPDPIQHEFSPKVCTFWARRSEMRSTRW